MRGTPKFVATLAELEAYPVERLMPRNEGTVYADPVKANNGLYLLSEDLTTWTKASNLAAAAHINRVQGGTHLYDTIAERNAIPLDLRYLGMNVKVWEGGREAGNGINPTQVAYILLGKKTPLVPAGYTFNGVTKPAYTIYEIVEYTGLYDNHPDYDPGNPSASQTNTRFGFAAEVDYFFADTRPDALYQMNFVQLMEDSGIFSVKGDEEHWYYEKYYYQEEIDSDGDGVVDSYRGYTLLDYPPYDMPVRILDVTPGTPEIPAGRDLMGITEDQSDVWAPLPVQAAVTYTTFEEMKEFRNKGQLEKYTYYAYEYSCCYIQNGTKLFTDANSEHQKELMICFATDANKISNIVQSAKHPGDVISMLFDAGIGGVPHHYGFMEFRFDPYLNITGGFDWRSMKVARYMVGGIKHDLVTKVSESLFAVTPILFWPPNHTTIPHEYFIDFGTAPLSNTAAPSLEVRATNDAATVYRLPLVDLNGQPVGANQIRTIVGATGKAHVYKSQPLNAWVLASSADEEAIVKDLPLLTPNPDTNGATVVRQLYRNAELLPTGGVQLFDIIQGIGSGARNIDIGANNGFGRNPNILLHSKRGGAVAQDVYFGGGCENVTVVRVDGENIGNVRVGRLCKDIVTIGAVARVEVPAFSEKVLLAGNSHRTLTFVEEPGAKPLSNVVLFAPKQDSTLRAIDLSFKLLSHFTMIVRGVGFVQAQLGEAEQSNIYIHTLFNRVRIGRFSKKVFERGSSWESVEYIGSSHLPTGLMQPQWFRGTIQSRMIVDTDGTIFNTQPAAGQNTDKLLSIDPLTGEVRTLAYPASQQVNGVVDATPNTIAQRDNLGGLFATEFTLVSDARLKTDLEKITPEQALNMVRQLSSYYYRRNDIDNAPLEIGYLAQEVQGIVPELTKQINHELYDDALGVNYSRAVTLLAPALQALYERILSLEKQLK